MPVRFKPDPATKPRQKRTDGDLAAAIWAARGYGKIVRIDRTG